MDLPLAYTIISLFGILNGPIRALPWFFGQFIEFVIAMKRIQKFLVCQEINETVVKKNIDQLAEDAIEISQSACFHWGTQPEKSEKDKDDEQKKDHKKVLKERSKEKAEQQVLL